MRRFIAYAGALTLMVAVFAVAAEPQRPRAFGHWGQVWGTWVWTTNNQIPALLTLHIDGTVSVSDGRMFGGLQPNSPTRLTPLHGVWERTGFQSIGGTTLYLIFDATTGVLRRGADRGYPSRLPTISTTFKARCLWRTYPAPPGRL